MAMEIEESWGVAPSGDAMVVIAKNAYARLSKFFADDTPDIKIHIEEFADEETLEALFIEDPYELRGVYSGIARSLELHDVSKDDETEIWLFRMPILRVWMEQGDITLEALITQALITEVAAHHRWSSKQVAELYQAASLAPPDWE